MSYEQRLSVQKATLLAKLQALLPDLFQRGYFPGHTAETFSIFIYGILGETGRALDFSDNIEHDREIFWQAFQTSMENMRSNA